PAAADRRRDAGRTYVVIGADSARGSALADLLEAHAGRCVRVAFGCTSARHDDRCYTLDMRDSAAYPWLLEALSADGIHAHDYIHLVAPGSPVTSLDALREAQEHGLYSI